MQAHACGRGLSRSVPRLKPMIKFWRRTAGAVQPQAASDLRKVIPLDSAGRLEIEPKQNRAGLVGDFEVPCTSVPKSEALLGDEVSRQSDRLGARLGGRAKLGPVLVRLRIGGIEVKQRHFSNRVLLKRARTNEKILCRSLPRVADKGCRFPILPPTVPSALN